MFFHPRGECRLLSAIAVLALYHVCFYLPIRCCGENGCGGPIQNYGPVISAHRLMAWYPKRQPITAHPRYPACLSIRNDEIMQIADVMGSPRVPTNESTDRIKKSIKHFLCLLYRKCTHNQNEWISILDNLATCHY